MRGPGEMGQSDFTDMRELAVTIGGPFQLRIPADGDRGLQGDVNTDPGGA